MYCKTPRHIVRLCCLMLFAVFLNTGHSPLWGQQPKERIYATSQTNGGLLGTVANADSVVGSGINTWATLNVPVGLIGATSAYIQPRFESTLQAGTATHLKVGINPSLIGIGITINIQAYNNNTAVGTSVNMGTLLSLLNGQYTEEIIFTPQTSGGTPVSYNGVRITLNGGAISLAANIDVYYAYYLKDATTSIACDAPAEVLYGSTGALLSGVNQVENPQNVIDGNISTFTRLRSSIGVLDKTYIRSLYNTLSRSGDSVRVVLRNPGGLLQASLLATNLTIATYNDTTSNGALELDESLLSLSLLPGSSDVQVLTYPVLPEFNRIEVAIGQGLLNALGDLYVYEISRIGKGPDITSPQFVDDVAYTCYGNPVTLNIADPLVNSIYRWYDAETGGTLLGTGTSYTPDTFSEGTTVYYLAEVREGCTEESARTSVTVHVLPDFGNPAISILNEND